jgi:CRP-like cAMP-binding protein
MQSLAQISFFKDIADVEFERFDRRCAWKRYEDGEVIVDFEDASTDVYFIITGEVRVLIRTAAGKEIILNELRNGEFFGEYAAIDGIKRSANVTALTKADLCIMPATVFREIVFVNTAAEKVMKRLVSRVRELNARLAEHSIFDLKHRLYSELLRLSQPRPGHPGQRAVSPPPFHHVLAARIGCRREQVTRELSMMSTEQLVEKTRGALVIRKPEVIEMRLQAALHEEG